MAAPSPLHALADLLRSGGALPAVSSERFAASMIYDLQYRLAVLACVYELHAGDDRSNTRGIKPGKLKLLQFVAMRPWLLPVVRKWSEERSDRQVSLWASRALRRGFLGDTVHEAVVEFCLASGMLQYLGSRLVSGDHGDYLSTVSAAVRTGDWFASERRTLEALRQTVITNDMLEGW